MRFLRDHLLKNYVLDDEILTILRKKKNKNYSNLEM